MSTDLVRDDRRGLYVTRYWGGDKDGVMVQITTVGQEGASYVTMRDRRYRALLRLLVARERKGG